MNVGMIDVDGHNFPNLALMKLSAMHKRNGDNVEWYSIFGNYDVVYMAKVFTHTADWGQIITNAEHVIKGGTGYDIASRLPDEAEHAVPDYSLYNIDDKTAYGFLTRGCIRHCKWCVVPKKEGTIHRYMDIDDIAVNGRNRVILMDNNILALADYAHEQLDKIIKRGLRIDFNQAMDARLVTDDFAAQLARVKWMKYIRFGCDTKQQINDCHDAIERIRANGYKGEFFLYTMLHGTIEECHERIAHWRNNGQNVTCFAQPYIDFTTKRQDIPAWQKDMARWANKKELYKKISFHDYEPRKGFRCAQYFQ